MLDTVTENHGHALGLGSLQSVFEANACSLDYRFAGRVPDRLIRLQRAGFGGIDVFRYESVGLLRTRRSYHHIRSDHSDDFLVSIPMRAPIVLLQSGRQTIVKPGNFAFMTTAKPFDAYGDGDAGDSMLELFARVSGPLLRQRVKHVDECCAHSVKLRPGAGKIMCSLFELALNEGRHLSEIQNRKFGEMLLDAIASTTLEAPELNSVADESRLKPVERVRQEAISYIEAHLSQPDLCVREIADHCHVSTRYLHSAFNGYPMTVGEVIREMRLTKCQTALRSAELRQRTITEIIMRWGFNDLGNFSRMYKARFGVTPNQDRNIAMSDGR